MQFYSKLQAILNKFPLFIFMDSKYVIKEACMKCTFGSLEIRIFPSWYSVLECHFPNKFANMTEIQISWKWVFNVSINICIHSLLILIVPSLCSKNKFCQYLSCLCSPRAPGNQAARMRMEFWREFRVCTLGSRRRQ